jgi:hypothetical protein
VPGGFARKIASKPPLPENSAGCPEIPGGRRE